MNPTIIENSERLTYHGVSLKSKHSHLCRHYAEEDGTVYFCNSGLRAVLNMKHESFRKAKVSMSPFEGSTEVNVEGNMFYSEFGKYRGCDEHPTCILNMMGRQGAAPDEFTFYAKIDEERS